MSHAEAGLLRAASSRTKRWLRSGYKVARSRYIGWRYCFDREELVAALRCAGLDGGDAVMVHSSFSAFEGFTGTAPDIITCFLDVLGPAGTLLMPTLSMAGSALEFASSGKVFSVKTTPSQVGLLTEVFRRSPGVSRSVHPTHSVAGAGNDVDWWLHDNHLAETPCGAGSPFHRLLERDGKIVLAGAGIESMTFFHCAEELLESRMPFSPFTAERYVMKCKVGGQIVETAPMRLYGPAVSRRRQLRPLEAELRAKGRWREAQAGTLKVVVLRAKEVLQTLEEMAARQEFCYTAA